MGERLNGIQEVMGSTPTVSIADTVGFGRRFSFCPEPGREKKSVDFPGKLDYNKP